MIRTTSRVPLSPYQMPIALRSRDSIAELVVCARWREGLEGAVQSPPLRCPVCIADRRSAQPVPEVGLAVPKPDRVSLGMQFNGSAALRAWQRVARLPTLKPSAKAVARTRTSSPLYEQPAALRVPGQDLLTWRKDAQRRIRAIFPSFQDPDTGPTAPELLVHPLNQYVQLCNDTSLRSDTPHCRGSSTGFLTTPVWTLSGSSAWVLQLARSPFDAPCSSWNTCGTDGWPTGDMRSLQAADLIAGGPWSADVAAAVVGSHCNMWWAAATGCITE